MLVHPAPGAGLLLNRDPGHGQSTNLGGANLFARLFMQSLNGNRRLSQIVKRRDTGLLLQADAGGSRARAAAHENEYC